MNWRVEADPTRLVTHRLVSDVYEQTGAWDRPGIARLGAPFDIDVDLTRLLRR